MPYLLWNVGYFALAQGLRILSGEASLQSAIGGLPRALGLIPWELPANGPLWFLKSLFLYVCVAPLADRWIRKTGIIGTLGLCLACLWLSLGVRVGSWTQMFGWTFSVNGFAYFAAGMFLRRADIAHLSSSRLLAGVCGVAVTALFAVARGTEWLGGAQRFWCTFSVPVALWSFWHFVPARTLPRWLTSLAFPLYLAHWPLLFALNRAASGLGLDTLLTGSLFGALIQLGVVVLSVSAAVFAGRRWAPRLTGILLGGR